MPMEPITSGIASATRCGPPATDSHQEAQEFVAEAVVSGQRGCGLSGASRYHPFAQLQKGHVGLPFAYEEADLENAFETEVEENEELTFSRKTDKIEVMNPTTNTNSAESRTDEVTLKEHHEFLRAVEAVMGDTSAASRQRANDLLTGYESLAATFSDAGGDLTEEVLRQTLPGRLFELASAVDWVPYFDDNGNIDPAYEGDAKLSWLFVKQTFYDGFIRLLPIQSYLDWQKQQHNWVKPTPCEILMDFQEEMGWRGKTKISKDFVLALMPAHKHTKFEKKKDAVDYAAVEVSGMDWRNTGERTDLDKIAKEPDSPVPDRVRDRHRKVAEYIGKHSKIYPNLDPVKLTWRPA